MVAGTKHRALLEGLRQSTEYRVHVRALSAIGESDASNTVIAHITPSLDQGIEISSIQRLLYQCTENFTEIRTILILPVNAHIAKSTSIPILCLLHYLEVYS